MESRASPRQPNPTDVSDDEWAFAAPDLSLMTEDAPQRRHALREVFSVARDRARRPPWRSLPNDLPWPTVSQQTRRWQEAGRLAAMTHDLREVLR